jgi:hypothetical protein
MAYRKKSKIPKFYGLRIYFSSTLLYFFLVLEANARFVPKQFLDFLGKENIANIKLGDQVQKDMTILFSDIRDFTSINAENAINAAIEMKIKLFEFNHIISQFGQSTIETGIGIHTGMLMLGIVGGEPEDLKQLKLETKPQFSIGLQLYKDKNFKEAEKIFMDILQTNPEDKAAENYIKRCAKFIKTGFPDDGDGIEIF